MLGPASSVAARLWSLTAAPANTSRPAPSSCRPRTTPAEKSKLAGVATGATANATDAALRDRATHTGTQAIGTVTGLQAALDGKLDTAGNAATATVGHGAHHRRRQL